MSSLTITKNYKLFSFTNLNRPVNLKNRKGLRESMQEYGYLKAYPLHCIRTKHGLEVQDGQHRLEIAKELGLPVAYVVCDTPIDIARINKTQKGWKLEDYMDTFIAQGNDDYRILSEFMEHHNLAISVAILMFTQSLGNCTLEKFKSGLFNAKSLENANRIAFLYPRISEKSKQIRTRSFAYALMSLCRISPPIDDYRLISNAQKCPEKLITYATCDGFLDMLEEVYNFRKGKNSKVNISWQARQVMKPKDKA